MSDLLRPDSITDLPGAAAALWGVLRETPPLTHCITNTVVAGFTANVLLAPWGLPRPWSTSSERPRCSPVSRPGVLINLGTPTPEQRAASLEAVAGAATAGTPWVLDPVAIGALRSAPRSRISWRGSVRRRSAGNASEILALAGLSAGGRGVDATDSTDAAADAAAALSATDRWRDRGVRSGRPRHRRGAGVAPRERARAADQGHRRGLRSRGRDGPHSWVPRAIPDTMPSRPSPPRASCTRSRPSAPPRSRPAPAASPWRCWDALASVGPADVIADARVQAGVL